MKCAKVIVFYFGARRAASNNTPIQDILSKIIDNEKIDVGVDTDTFFVVNKSESPLDNLLDEYDGMLTTNGKIRVVKRNNIGLSFGGYLDVFNTYKREYDYWVFLEDDVIIYKEGYVKDFIDELNSTNSTFIALAPISNLIKTHCGGGCGLTSTKYMENVYTTEFVKQKLEEWSKYRGYDVASNQLMENNAEIQFTSHFELKNHHKYSPLCINYKKHSSQLKYLHLHNPNLEFIYSVGKL